MRLSVVKFIKKANLARSGEVPAWIDALLRPINKFMDETTRALTGRLTFADNFQCTVKEVEFTSGTELKLNPEASNLRVIGIIPVRFSSGKTLTGHKHEFYNDGSVGITFTFSEGGSSTCRVIILLG